MFDFSAYRYGGSLSDAAAAACFLSPDGTAAAISEGEPGTGRSLCEISMDGVLLTGSAAPGSRIQIYRDGRPVAFTKDLSPAWARYQSGDISYADIRLQKDCVVGGGEAPPARISADLRAGDGVLLCTANFWRYLFEEEIAADLLKSENAQAWRDYLLVRLSAGTRLAGGSFCVICGIWRSGADGPAVAACSDPPTTRLL